MISALHIAAFLRRNCAPFLLWQKGMLLFWINWHLREDLVTVITTNGKITGVGMLRTLIDPKDHENLFLHQPEGKHAFIDIAVTQSLSDFKALYLEIRNHIGDKPFVSFIRQLRDDKLRTYQMKTFEKILIGESYGIH